MATGPSIGPKIQVDGVDAYYKDIQRVIAQGKALGKQMSEVGKDFDGAGDSSSRFVDVLKANLTSEAIIGGIKAIGKGVLEIGKSLGSFIVDGVKSFAGLEQNIGGAEAVFGEFASGIQKSAEQAYRTMGATQSEYLATANKMGALFQGSGLDAQRSMDLTTQAMQRAADMASVMGIDTQSALDAVTAAAKGNYTMMDNLGVAMNATTLEAYRVSQGMDTAFSKMTNAEKAELAMKYFFENTTQYAGNFEREASTTISGSIGQLTAAVQTWVAGLGNSQADITTLTQNIVLAFQSVVSNVVPVVQNIIGSLPQVFQAIIPAIEQLLPMLLATGGDLIYMLVEGIQSALPSLLAAARPLISTLVKGIFALSGMLVKSGGEILGSIIGGISDAFPDLLSMAFDVVFSFVETIKDGSNLEKLLQTGLTILTSFISGLQNAIPKLVQFVPKIIQNIVNTLTNAKNVAEILKSAASVITSFIMGLSETLPKLAAMAPQIISTIVTTITSKQFISTVVDAAVSIVGALITGLLSMLKNIGAAAISLGTAIVNGLGNILTSVFDIGSNLVTGIWDGIKSGTSWIKNKIKEWVGDVTKFIKRLFGIHSPSTVMRDEVGKFLALGIGEGFTDEMKYVAKNMVASVPMDFSMAGGGVTNMGGVTINIQGAEGQDVEELANIVMFKMQRAVDRREAVFA